MMEARIMENCEKYLGLPMVGGKAKINTLKTLGKKSQGELWDGRRNIFLKQVEKF